MYSQTCVPTGRACHFGLNTANATDVFLNTNWTGYSAASPKVADEAINLDFLFPVLDVGASVTFSFVYILQAESLQTAMGNVGHKEE